VGCSRSLLVLQPQPPTQQLITATCAETARAGGSHPLVGRINTLPSSSDWDTLALERQNFIINEGKKERYFASIVLQHGVQDSAINVSVFGVPKACRSWSP
jgi:hypothetical protein